MLASYLLSRTLVPTMVLYLLPAEVPLYTDPQAAPATRRRTRSGSFITASIAASSGCAPPTRACSAGRSIHRCVTLVRDARLRRSARWRWLRGSARTSSRRSTPASSGCTCGRRPARASKRPSAIFGQVEDVIREIVPDKRAGDDPRQHGPDAVVHDSWPTSTTAPSATATAKSWCRSSRTTGRPRTTSPGCGKNCRRRFPDCTFYFQPADITSQILDFGLPAPIDVQVVGVNREGNLAVAQKLRSEMAKIPGIADVHIHQITDYADAAPRRGPHPGVGAGADAAET